jgi:asparagine synthase (glutamine-hydrolysing)
LRTFGHQVSFVRHDALPDDVEEYIKHPWTHQREDLPKGKQFQIELIAELLNRHRFTPDLLYAPEHHPLISQPLLDLSFRIPIYLLTHGGRQRGLAREAFHDIVPAEILAREDKGSTIELWIHKIRESEAFIRDLLLDGWLADKRLIDRAALEPHLVGHQPIRPEQWSQLAACIAAEIWVRSWLSRRRSATALHAARDRDSAAALVRP